MADGEKLTFTVRSLGCKANQYEKDVIAAQMREIGLEQTGEGGADVFILNTCTVTAEAGRKSRQILRQLRKHNPEAIAIAMGCESELFDLTPWADICVGTTMRNSICRQLICLLEARGRADSFSPESRAYAEQLARQAADDQDSCSFEEPFAGVIPSETRAQLKICDGCNNRCAYCAISLARGPVRSRSPECILQEAVDYVRQGIHEIVLTGIEICSYGDDFPAGSPDLATVLKELNKIDGLCRLRLASLDPARIDDKFIGEIAQLEKLCAHFHLSLQSGSDSVLQRMDRKYNTRQYLEIVKGLRAIWPEAGFTTDIICGFPGETKKEFEETYDFCQTVGFQKLHVFPYSRRPGTKAAEMPDQIPSSVKKRRAGKLLDLSKQMAAEQCRRRIGTAASVLLEREIAPGIGEGYTRTYLPCVFQLPDLVQEAQAGDLFLVRLEKCEGGVLSGVGMLPEG
ncbi:MAG: tRNA (N(6)-L-threonylcarbamoyladenosine(37)-C(2))-methylthiotransferase MtaB [Saccharofermentanales bacterium]|jgi:threonylcarbamoyladenosine tRNA methylthiotransferase MtaB|nr:tRNA (N(6)-L-threonylcarbamoyladenosine(37)-C(2))-methylthiotransferase MtaB [Bacillota bacterium]